MNFKSLYIFLALTLVSFSARTSHISGGDITFQCLGGNTYRITLALYRDCSGIPTGNTEAISTTNNCGFANLNFIQLNRINNPNSGQQVTEISQICQPMVNLTTCNGGNLPGMQLIYYSGVVNLPGACNSWNFYHSSGARNTTVNLTGQQFYYFGASINSVTAPCNNGPVFTGHQTPYVCINQPVNYNYGVVEPDGDSLVFTLINALTTGPLNPVNYNPPYTGAMPINGISLDAATGQLTFTPTIVGGFVVAVLVTEYERGTGAVKGAVMRDIQFVVQNCGNQIVNVSNVNVSNYVGGGAPTGPKEIQVCEGDQFCFDLVITDPNPADVVTITSNIATALPGATMTLTATTNPVTATVCWTVPANSNPLNIATFQIRDNACPVIGQAIFSVIIRVIRSTVATNDVTICNGDTANLGVTGGNQFTWRTISGDPIVIGDNFSCNPCANPNATPKQTTAYEVTSNLGGGCNNVDTVVVTNDHPTILFSTDTTNGCYPVLVNFSNDTDPTKVSTTSWDFGNGITSSSVNVQLNYDSPGVYDVNLTVTSPNGCVEDSTTVGYITAYDFPVANFSASPQPTNTSNTQINFQDLSTSDVINWDWNFGISDLMFNNTSYVQNPTNKYPDLRGDTYYVRLAVENIAGCSDTIIKEIIINDVYTLYVPNSFTPNGDGINDSFIPYAEQMSNDDYEFRVFNRWGNTVFFTINPNEAWDGKNSEDYIVDQGIYSWTVRAVDNNNGDKYFYKGHIMLIK